MRSPSTFPNPSHARIASCTCDQLPQRLCSLLANLVFQHLDSPAVVYAVVCPSSRSIIRPVHTIALLDHVAIHWDRKEVIRSNVGTSLSKVEGSKSQKERFRVEDDKRMA